MGFDMKCRVSVCNLLNIYYTCYILYNEYTFSLDIDPFLRERENWDERGETLGRPCG